MVIRPHHASSDEAWTVVACGNMARSVCQWPRTMSAMAGGRRCRPSSCSTAPRRAPARSRSLPSCHWRTYTHRYINDAVRKRCGERGTPRPGFSRDSLYHPPPPYLHHQQSPPTTTHYHPLPPHNHPQPLTTTLHHHPPPPTTTHHHYPPSTHCHHHHHSLPHGFSLEHDDICWYQMSSSFHATRDVSRMSFTPKRCLATCMF